MPVANLTAELMGTFPRLPYLHALQLINRAWARVQDIRLWSWQFITDGQIYAPALISAGSVSATYQSPNVTVDATAAAAINSAASVPPIASQTLGVGRQIKIGSTSGISAPNGPNYTITAWDGVNTLTLDKPYGEATQANAQYQLYKCFYAPPSYPFTSLSTPDASLIRFVSLTNKNSGYTIRGRKLHWTQAQLNAIDPQRGGTGDPYIIAPYGRNAAGQITFELYPNPVTQATYSVTWYERWPSVSATQDFPQVPYGLVTCVMDMARALCCQWALANVATYAELQQTNWVAAQQMYKQDFLDGLKMCLRQDDEIMPQVPFSQSSRFDFPLGGQFLQSHDLSSLLP